VSRPRLAFGRIAQESNAFSPVRTTLEDFRRVHWLEGQALLDACGPAGVEAEGFIRSAELSGFVKAASRARGQVELVPLFSAWAVPGGPLAAEALAALKAKLVASLRAAGPLDGLYLALHGALVAEGSEDPEAELLAAAREVIGPDATLAVSFDLHAQLTRAKVAPIDVLTAYRTNPHRDHAKVGYRSGRILIRSALGDAWPRLAWRSLPMVLGGGTTIDLLPTMRPLYARLRRLERDRRVLYASLFNCHLWNDHPDLGWSVAVVTDGDQALAEELADDLAERAWGVRHVQPPAFPTAAEAIDQARAARLARRLGCVCVCDASDIVGAGSTGENTALLRAILERGQGLMAYAPLRDASAVDAIWGLPVGAEVSRAVGGRLHPEVNTPLTVRGRVGARAECDARGRRVVLAVDHLRLVLTDRAPIAMKPQFYTDLGLDPWRADVVVVKSMFPFRWYYRASNRKSIYARTRGITDLDYVARLTFRDPVHPQDPVEDWRPADRRRRLG